MKYRLFVRDGVLMYLTCQLTGIGVHVATTRCGTLTYLRPTWAVPSAGRCHAFPEPEADLSMGRPISSLVASTS